MASNYTQLNNAIPIINNFGLKAAQLLDAKGSVADKETLNALITDGFVTEGQITYCEENSTLYIAKIVNNVLTWVEVGGSTLSATYDEASETLTLG